MFDEFVYQAAATTLPSGWTATPFSSTPNPLTVTVTLPAPKVVSSEPFGFSRVRTPDLRPMTIFPSGATTMDDGGYPFPGTLATPKDPNVGSGVPSGNWRVTGK